MRDKFIKFLENYGLWMLAVWLLFIMMMMGLSSCSEVKEKNDKLDSAIQLKSKIYKTNGVWNEHIEVFEMDGYKFILWHNGYGSDMEVIPLDDAKAFEQLSKDYEELWDENQKLFGVLAEIENEPGGHEMLKKLWNENTK